MEIGVRAFQKRVQAWIKECFVDRLVTSREERAFRFLEESLELVQAVGLPKTDAQTVLDYVYNRPKGEPSQEVGGVMVTLSALCSRESIDMQDAAFTEIERIEAPEVIEIIRAKQDTKSAAGLGVSKELEKS